MQGLHPRVHHFAPLYPTHRTSDAGAMPRRDSAQEAETAHNLGSEFRRVAVVLRFRHPLLHGEGHTKWQMRHSTYLQVGRSGEPR